MLPSLVDVQLHFKILFRKLSQILWFKTVFLFYDLSLRPYISVNGSIWPQPEAMRCERVKLAFIAASALLGMCSIYIGQLVRATAASLILRMRAYTGGVAYTLYYPYPAASNAFNNALFHLGVYGSFTRYSNNDRDCD